MPELEIRAYDLDQITIGTFFRKLRFLPSALSRGGVRILRPKTGRFTDALKVTNQFMEMMAREIGRIQQKSDFDFSLATSGMIPVMNPICPHFVYTDQTVMSNLYYPDGQSQVELWRERLPYERKCLENATGVFTMSEHVRRSCIELYGLTSSKVRRVNAGCNTPPVLNPNPKRFERQNVLFIGLAWERKGGPALVSAFAELRKRLAGATLTIVGCNPQLREDGINVVGRVPQEEVPAYLGNATVFCMPSRREPFGVAYLEAMRTGLPVIAPDVGAPPDFVINGETGYRVNPDDTEGLVLRLKELLTDPVKCRAMGQRGRALVESEYTWERTQRVMWETIRESLGRHRGGSGRNVKCVL